MPWTLHYFLCRLHLARLATTYGYLCNRSVSRLLAWALVTCTPGSPILPLAIQDSIGRARIPLCARAIAARSGFLQRRVAALATILCSMVDDALTHLLSMSTWDRTIRPSAPLRKTAIYRGPALWTAFWVFLAQSRGASFNLAQPSVAVNSVSSSLRHDLACPLHDAIARCCAWTPGCPLAEFAVFVASAWHI